MVKKVAIYSNVLLFLTSIHHIYGAYIYDTSWRLHVLAFSIPIMGFNILLLKFLYKRKIWHYVFWLVNILYSVSQIGLFEGVYNHLIKVVLFYSATNEEIMQRLFPPSVYEMPNDFFFELTGVLQAFVLIPLIYYCFIALKKKKFFILNDYPESGT